MTHILCSNFDINKLSYTEADTYEYTPTLLLSFPKYDNKAFIFETPEIQITNYCLQPLGDFAKTDKDREFIKVPLDVNQEGCVELKEMISEIEAHFEENYKNCLIHSPMLNKIINTFKPIKIIKEKMQEEDEEDNSKSNSNANKKWCIFKFKTDHNTGNITTKVFINNNNKITPLNATTVTDIEQYLKWGSTIRMIVHMNKAWFEKIKNLNTNHRQCGLTFKILQLEITPKKQPQSIDNIYSKYSFSSKSKKNNDIEDSDEGIDIEI